MSEKWMKEVVAQGTVHLSKFVATPFFVITIYIVLFYFIFAKLGIALSSLVIYFQFV